MPASVVASEGVDFVDHDRTQVGEEPLVVDAHVCSGYVVQIGQRFSDRQRRDTTTDNRAPAARKIDMVVVGPRRAGEKCDDPG